MSDQLLSSLGRDPVAALEFGTASFYTANFLVQLVGFSYTEYQISPVAVTDPASVVHFDLISPGDPHGDVTLHLGDDSNQPATTHGWDSAEFFHPTVKNYNTPVEPVSSDFTGFGIPVIYFSDAELYLNFVDNPPTAPSVLHISGEFFKPEAEEPQTEYGLAVMIYDRNVNMIGDTLSEVGERPRVQTDPVVELNFVTTKVASSSALHLTFSGDRIIRLPGYEDSSFSLAVEKDREFVTTSGFTSTTYGVPGYTHEYGWLRLSLDFAYDWPGDNVPFYFGVSRGFIPYSISPATAVYSPTFIPDHVLDFDQDPLTEFGDWVITDDRQFANLIGAPSFVEFGDFGVGYRRHVELTGAPAFTQFSPAFIANYTRYLILFSREAPPDDYGNAEFISRDQMLWFFGDAFFASWPGLRITKAELQEFPLRGLAWPHTYYGASEISYTGPLHVLLQGNTYLGTSRSTLYNRDQYVRQILPANELPYFTRFGLPYVYIRQPQFYNLSEADEESTAYDTNSISTDPHLIDFNPQLDDDPIVSIDSLSFGLPLVGTTQYVNLIQSPPYLRMTNPKVVRWLEIGLAANGVYGLHTLYGEWGIEKTPEFPLQSVSASTQYSPSWFSHGKQFVTIEDRLESFEGRFLLYVVTRDRTLVLDDQYNAQNFPMTKYGRARAYLRTQKVKVQGISHFDSSWFGNKLRLRDQLFPYLWDTDTAFGEDTLVGYYRREVRMKDWPPQAVVWLRQVHSYDRQLRYDEYNSVKFGTGSLAYPRKVQLKGVSHTKFLVQSVGHSPRYVAFWGLAPPSPQLGDEGWVSHGSRILATGPSIDSLQIISQWGLRVEHVPPLVAEILSPKSNEKFGYTTVYNKNRYVEMLPQTLSQLPVHAFNTYNLNQWRDLRSVGDTLEWPYSIFEITHDTRDVFMRGLFASVPPARHMTWIFNELTVEDYTQFIEVEGADHLGLDPRKAGLTVMSMTLFLNGYDAAVSGDFAILGNLIEIVQTYYLTRFGVMRVGTPVDQWVYLKSNGEDGLFTAMAEKSKCPSGPPGLTIIPMTIQLSSGTAPTDGCSGQSPKGDFLAFNTRSTYPRGAFEIMTRDQVFFLQSDGYYYKGTHTAMGASHKLYRRPEYIHLEGKHSLSRGPLEVQPYNQTSFQFGISHLEFGAWSYEGGGVVPPGTNPFEVTVTMHGLASQEFTYYVERFNRTIVTNPTPESLVFGNNNPWISYPRGFELHGVTHTVFDDDGAGYLDYGTRSVIIGDFESFEPVYYYNNISKQPYGRYFFTPIQDDAMYGNCTVYKRDQKVLLFGSPGACPPHKVQVTHE